MPMYSLVISCGKSCSAVKRCMRSVGNSDKCFVISMNMFSYQDKQAHMCFSVKPPMHSVIISRMLRYQHTLVPLSPHICSVCYYNTYYGLLSTHICFVINTHMFFYQHTCSVISTHMFCYYYTYVLLSAHIRFVITIRMFCYQHTYILLSAHMFCFQHTYILV